MLRSIHHILGHNFGLRHLNNILRTPFFPFYDLQTDVSHNGVHLKFSTFPHQPLFGGGGRGGLNSQLRKKITLDYLSNICQSAFENCESFRLGMGGGVLVMGQSVD